MSVSNNIVIFSIIVVIACGTTTVDAACVDRENVNSTSDSAMDKVSNFFVDIGCTIRSGADKVKERVESGYNYLKSKITPDDVKNATSIDNVEQMVQTDDQMKIKDDTATKLPEITTASSHDGGKKVENRVAITAPQICPHGQIRLDGKCRTELFDLE